MSRRTWRRRPPSGDCRPELAGGAAMTHKEPFNLVHRLDRSRPPMQAWSSGCRSRASSLARMAVPISASTSSGASPATGWPRRYWTSAGGSGAGAAERHRPVRGVRQPQYRGLVADTHERKPDCGFREQTQFRVGTETGVDAEVVWRDQIRYTIRTHSARQGRIDSREPWCQGAVAVLLVESVADHRPGCAACDVWTVVCESGCAAILRARCPTLPSCGTSIYQDGHPMTRRVEHQMLS